MFWVAESTSSAGQLALISGEHRGTEQKKRGRTKCPLSTCWGLRVGDACWASFPALGPRCGKAYPLCVSAGNPRVGKAATEPTTGLHRCRAAWVQSGKWMTKKNDKNAINPKIAFLVEVTSRITANRVQVINLFRETCASLLRLGPKRDRAAHVILWFQRDWTLTVCWALDWAQWSRDSPAKQTSVLLSSAPRTMHSRLNEKNSLNHTKTHKV